MERSVDMWDLQYEVNTVILSFITCGTTITYNNNRVLSLIKLEGLLLKVLSKVVCYFKVRKKRVRTDLSDRKHHLFM